MSRKKIVAPGDLCMMKKECGGYFLFPDTSNASRPIGMIGRTVNEPFFIVARIDDQTFVLTDTTMGWLRGLSPSAYRRLNIPFDRT